MKKSILVLTIFIFMVGFLAAAGNMSTINTPKPMSEQSYSQSLPNTQTSTTNLPNRQNYLTMDFTGLTGLPAGWTIDAAAAHWTVQQSALAGGTAPELRFDWSPQYVGISRFISPNVDLTGQTTVHLEFKHSVDHYATPYTLGVATRSGGGAWNSVWTISPTAAVPSTIVDIPITNTDVGSSTFQFCLYFSGDSYNINDWYMDNIRLYVPFPHDVKVKSLSTDYTYTVDTNVVPAVAISNVGLNTEAFDVTCVVYEFDTQVYTQTINMTLTAGQFQNATFPPFLPSAPDELYKVLVYTSLVGDQDTSNDSMFVYFNTYTGQKQKVMVEIGTGTWCQYCPGAALGADDPISNGNQCAIVEYHNGDTFTNDDSNTSNTYYNITGFPTATFDGMVQYIGGNHTTSVYPAYLPLYNAAYAVKTPFHLSMAGSLDGTTLSTYVKVNKTARVLAEPLVVRFAVTQSEIAFSWQGQSQLNFVERAMAPNFGGTQINMLEPDSLTVPLTVTIDPTWDAANLELVADVQNPVTKRIYQAIVVPLIDLPAYIVVNPPLNLTSQTSAGVVTLNWLDPATSAGLTAFKIYRNGELVYTQTHINIHQFMDTPGNGSFSYYVTAVFGTLESDPSNTLSVTGANDPTVVPVVSTLNGNYPNPFRSSTLINYQIAQKGLMDISIYNVKGQLVRTLINENKSAGTYNAEWNGTDNNGNKLPSGIYLIHFNTGNVKQTIKTILVK